MAKRRKTEVTIRTREVVVVHSGQTQYRAWCPQCCAERAFVLPEEAARLAGVSVRTIFHRIEDERIHYLETRDGLMRICCESISGTSRSLPGGTQQ